MINYMLLPVMACNANCDYCFAKKNGQVMTIKTAMNALDFIEVSSSDFTLTFHGGEPLLAGLEFYEFILPELRRRFGRRVHISIQSNLHAMTEEFAELFSRYMVTVATSMDGPKDMCDSHRGEGYYDKTMRGVEILKEHGVSVSNICTFTKDYAGRGGEVFAKSTMPYAIHPAISVDAKMAESLRYSEPGARDRSSGTEERLSGTEDFSSGEEGWLLSPEDYARVLGESYEAYKSDMSHNRIKTLDAMAAGILRGSGVVCTFTDCLGSFAAVDPVGDIYPCQRFVGIKEFVLGNVNDGLTAEEVFESPAFIRLKEIEERKKAACGDCTHLPYCSGGCLYNSLSAVETTKELIATEKENEVGPDEGNAQNRDPYCMAYRVIFDKMARDMALEMGAVMLGKKCATPVLAMAGETKHPYEMTGKSIGKSTEKPTEKPTGKSIKITTEKTGLNKLYLHITNSCPLHCNHCYAEGGDKKYSEMQPERLAEIVREAAEAGFETIVITGGEPLVYSGFDRLTYLLASVDLRKAKLVLRTSFAFEFKDDILKKILNTFDEITVSIDGDKDTHDRRRGDGSYEITVANLKKAVAEGGADRVGICAVLTKKETEGDAGESVRNLAKELGIKPPKFRPLLPLGRGTWAERELWQVCEDENRTGGGESLPKRLTCGLGYNLYVKPDGSAYPCYAFCEKEAKVGDVSEESLTELLNSEKFKYFGSRSVDTNEKCKDCEVRYLCGGICKVWARNKTDPDSGDFDCSDRKKYYLRLMQNQS